MAIYKGTEVKFGIDLQASGFSMDADDFEIEISSPRGSVKGSKGNPEPTSKVRIFKEDSDSSSSSSSAETTGGWFVIAETDTLSQGELKVIATAYIPDANAADLIRKEVVVAKLDSLANP